jgi:molecular chaperone IbpA
MELFNYDNSTPTVSTRYDIPVKKHPKQAHEDALRMGEFIRNQKPLPPQEVTLESLFPKYGRWAIGFDPIFETLQQMSSAKTLTYPPYNLTKLKNGKFRIELALAGWSKQDVHVSVKDSTLTISSELDEPNPPIYGINNPPDENSGEVLHHGIAKRAFKQQFALADYVEVESAAMKDGILAINLVTNIPDEKKPKVIDIK